MRNSGCSAPSPWHLSIELLIILAQHLPFSSLLLPNLYARDTLPIPERFAPLAGAKRPVTSLWEAVFRDRMLPVPVSKVVR